MSIKHIIKIKKLSEENEKKFYETDRPRFEEQDEEEYRKQLKRFFKGENEETDR
jgi:hypothetical protein